MAEVTTFADFIMESDARVEAIRAKYIEGMTKAFAGTFTMTSPDLIRQWNLGFDKIVQIDPTPNKIYLQWLVTGYVRSMTNHDYSDRHFEDERKIRNALTLYDKFKNRIVGPVVVGPYEKPHLIKNPADIYQFQHYHDLIKVMEMFEGEKTNNELKRDEIARWKAQITTVYDGPDGKIYIPHSEEASRFLGRGTKWCTAYTDIPTYFNTYNKQGPLYVLVTPQGKKFQVHLETSQWMDDGDRNAKVEIGKLPLYKHLSKIFDEVYIDLLRTGNMRAYDHYRDVGLSPEAEKVALERLNSLYDIVSPDQYIEDRWASNAGFSGVARELYYYLGPLLIHTHELKEAMQRRAILLIRAGLTKEVLEATGNRANGMEATSVVISAMKARFVRLVQDFNIPWDSKGYQPTFRESSLAELYVTLPVFFRRVGVDVKPLFEKRMIALAEMGRTKEIDAALRERVFDITPDFRRALANRAAVVYQQMVSDTSSKAIDGNHELHLIYGMGVLDEEFLKFIESILYVLDESSGIVIVTTRFWFFKFVDVILYPIPVK